MVICVWIKVMGRQILHLLWRQNQQVEENLFEHQTGLIFMGENGWQRDRAIVGEIRFTDGEQTRKMTFYGGMGRLGRAEETGLL